MTTPRKDHWTSSAYNSAAGFVPKLTTTVVSYLNPQPSDKILDIGCGDGELTYQIAQKTTSGKVLGVDASNSFIETARERYPSIPFILHDATELESCPEVVTGEWDKVFSNAAMHWILRKESTRKKFFENVHSALKPDGSFVFEMGGHGNVAEVLTASIAALTHAGVPLQQAREASPWFFPSTVWMENMLKDVGFEIEKVETEYRPSKLKEGADGCESWVRLMCADFLEAVEEKKRDGAVKEICDLIETSILREEDGSRWMGYLRLRGVARKK